MGRTILTGTQIDISRLQQHGGSHVVVLTKPILRELCWNRGDRIAMRIINGQRLVLQRIPLDELAHALRTQLTTEQSKQTAHTHGKASQHTPFRN